MLPKALYDLAPGFYITSGTLVLLGFGTAWISGILLIIAGLMVYEMRLSYRNH